MIFQEKKGNKRINKKKDVYKYLFEISLLYKVIKHIYLSYYTNYINENQQSKVLYQFSLHRDLKVSLKGKSIIK